MLIKVTENNVKISEDIVLHKGEYGIHKCQFEFSEEYNNLSKIAVFKSGNEIYKIDIINNECDIPAGALERTGNIIIGLYAYITENDELKLR